MLELTGKYSAGALLKCENCLSVSKSTQKNSCPTGTKLWAPRNRDDWKTFLASGLSSLRAPHWIVDVTNAQNGPGCCGWSAKNYNFHSGEAQQAAWKTADGAPWWLRSTKYNEPNGDYKANCYLDLWKNPTTPDDVQWNDGNCNYHSKSYYCQPDKTAPPPTPAPLPPTPPPTPKPTPKPTPAPAPKMPAGVKWYLSADVAGSCDAVCKKLVGGKCSQAGLDSLALSASNMQPAALQTAYQEATGQLEMKSTIKCNKWNTGCKGGNCKKWGLPFIHSSHFNDKLCWGGDAVAACNQAPVDGHHRRLCPCSGR